MRTVFLLCIGVAILPGHAEELYVTLGKQRAASSTILIDAALQAVVISGMRWTSSFMHVNRTVVINIACCMAPIK